ncbi:hypothetical protein NicSoilC5_09960 [Arthrobacter sp. NicSoilC5]|nr:hypothetical protein NicSoilC5_09960 [Arthrobacter sp. NicSoilC5]
MSGLHRPGLSAGGEGWDAWCHCAMRRTPGRYGRLQVATRAPVRTRGGGGGMEAGGRPAAGGATGPSARD